MRIALFVALFVGAALVAQSRDDSSYWNCNRNGDLTRAEALARGEGLRLPAYRDGTGITYAWLPRGRRSDADYDAIA